MPILPTPKLSYIPTSLLPPSHINAIQDSLAPHLPPELINHIIYLLPVRSLIRYGSASYKWPHKSSQPRPGRRHESTITSYILYITVIEFELQPALRETSYELAQIPIHREWWKPQPLPVFNEDSPIDCLLVALDVDIIPDSKSSSDAEGSLVSTTFGYLSFLRRLAGEVVTWGSRLRDYAEGRMEEDVATFTVIMKEGDRALLTFTRWLPEKKAKLGKSVLVWKVKRGEDRSLDILMVKLDESRAATLSIQIETKEGVRVELRGWEVGIYGVSEN